MLEIAIDSFHNLKMLFCITTKTKKKEGNIILTNNGKLRVELASTQ